MTGPEHYREAESWLESAGDRNSTDPEQAGFLAIAQIHATLALAAAVGLSEAVKVGAVPPSSYAGWADVATDPRPAVPAEGETSHA